MALREILQRATDTYPELDTLRVYIAQDCTGRGVFAVRKYFSDIAFEHCQKMHLLPISFLDCVSL